MRTSSNLPFRGLTTRTTEPKGRFGCAAVSASQSNFSPLAVFLPSKPGPYQLALPTQVLIGLAGSLRWATSGASIAGAIRNISGTQRTAAQIMKSGRFIVLSFCYKLPEKCSTKESLCQSFSRLNFPRISFIVNTLASKKAFGSSRTSPSLAVGSVKLAVPTCTQVAPTERYSSTSAAVSMPPSPIIGVVTALDVSQTNRWVIGLIAGPERPPVLLPSFDREDRKSSAMAG